MKKTYLSQAAFGKRIGVFPAAVGVAIRSNRITLTKMNDGSKKLCWETEHIKFIRTSKSEKVLKKWSHVLNTPAQKHKQNKIPKKIGRPVGSSNRGPISKKPTTQLEAQEALAIAKASKAQLDFQVAEGKLVDLQLVNSVFADIASSVQSNLLSIADRIAPMCEGLTHAEIHIILNKEIKHALQHLAIDITQKISQEKDN